MFSEWLMIYRIKIAPIDHTPFTKKESPDVETPGLLVKALISSYFKKSCFFMELLANITACSQSCKKLSYHFRGIFTRITPISPSLMLLIRFLQSPSVP